MEVKRKPCPACGLDLSVYAVRCKRCGHELKESVATAVSITTAEALAVSSALAAPNQSRMSPDEVAGWKACGLGLSIVTLTMLGISVLLALLFVQVAEPARPKEDSLVSGVWLGLLGLLFVGMLLGCQMPARTEGRGPLV